MKDRAFSDFMVGVLACACVLGFSAILQEMQLAREGRRRTGAMRWQLPVLRRASTPENDCRHCAGLGLCRSCGPLCCVCGGSGAQPRDAMLLARLDALWDGVA